MLNVILRVIVSLAFVTTHVFAEERSKSSVKDAMPVEDSGIALNKEIVRSVFKALESGDLELLNRVFNPTGKSVIGSLVRDRGGPFKTFAGAAPFPASLDDRSVTIEALFAEKDKVAVQSTICGIHARTLVGYEPTGKRLCARYTNLYTLKGGEIMENVVGFDPQLRKTLEKNVMV